MSLSNEINNDEVVSMISHRDYALIVTKRGKIFKLKIGDVYGNVMVQELLGKDIFQYSSYQMK